MSTVVKLKRRKLDHKLNAVIIFRYTEIKTADAGIEGQATVDNVLYLYILPEINCLQLLVSKFRSRVPKKRMGMDKARKWPSLCRWP